MSNSFTTNIPLLPPKLEFGLRAPGATARINPNSRVKIVTNLSASPNAWVLRLIPVALYVLLITR